MSDQTDKYIKSLEAYGLTPDEAIIYLDLIENGALSALQISRNVSLGRTKVYRILDKLIEKELVLRKPRDSGLTFVADPPSQLELLLTKREGELKTLREMLPTLVSNLETHSRAGIEGSQVLYYRGARGHSQVNWHLTRAQHEFLSYEVDNAEAYLSKQESEDLRARLVQKNISIRSFTNLKSISSFTNVAGLMNLWQVKHLDPSLLKISADIFIYNNVYAIVNYLSPTDVFAAEIYNQQLADMQRSLFEHLWSSAKPLTFLDEHGTAKLL